MKLCHLVLTPRHSGAEIIVGHLAKHQLAEGHRVTVASLKPSDDRFLPTLDEWRQAGVDLFINDRDGGGPLQRRLDIVRHLRQLVKREAPDVVFAHSIIPSAYMRLAQLGLGKRTKVVTVLHSSTQDDYASRPAEYSEKFLPAPDAVIAVSPLGATNYKRRFPRPTPVEVIPNGIDLGRILEAKDKSQAKRQELLAEFPAIEGRKLLLQVGRIIGQKQQIQSVQALGALKRDGLEPMLLLAGLVEDEAYFDAMMSIAKAEGVEDQILVLGSRKDVPELLAAADVYLMPSKSEAHSVAYLEALASDIPTVASELAVFDFSRTFPGVWLVDPHTTDRFAQAIKDSLHEPRKPRDLSAYDLLNMSSCYVKLAESIRR